MAALAGVARPTAAAAEAAINADRRVIMKSNFVWTVSMSGGLCSLRYDKEPADKILASLRQHKEWTTPASIVRSMQGTSSEIGFEMTVDEVLHQWPSTIRVFLDFRMNCVGCPIAGFHTVEDACREHGAAPRDFLSALQAAVAANGSARRAFGDAEKAVGIAHDDALPPAFDEALLFPRA